MLCKSPYMIGPLPCACQRCMPCRVNKKRLWTFRCEVEAEQHRHSSVATLTYRKSRLPEGGTLEKTHLQKFLKRLRKAYFKKTQKKIRYFACGEYGLTSKRPHYHIILFGAKASDMGGENGRQGLVNRSWKFGNTLVDDCSPEAIAYVAGYVTKKLNTDERTQKGLAPEFIRMSLRPYGIGGGSIPPIARVLKTPYGLESIAITGDVPHALRRGGKTVPIGRYLRGLLREKVLGTRDTPKAAKLLYWQEMWALRKKAQADPARKAQTFAQYLIDMNKQKVLNLEARTKIFAGKNKI